MKAMKCIAAWMLLVMTMVGCATAPEHEEPVVYVEAQKDKPKPVTPKVVAVPVAQPAPGQLRPAPRMEVPTEDQIKAAKKRKKTWAVVDEANDKAKAKPIDDGFYNAVQVYDYARGMLYQLYAAPMKLTAVEMESGEKVVSVAVGDTIRWVVGQTMAGNKELVLVKPVRPGLHTNMVITTDRRIYQLELHSFKNTYMASLSWNYPRAMVEQYAMGAPDEAAQESVELKTSVEKLNFNYGFVVDDPDDPPAWMPQMVYDDGFKTYIQFKPGTEKRQLPAFFVLSRKGKPQIVNFRVKGDLMVVDATFKLAQLRLGEDDPITVGIERMGGR